MAKILIIGCGAIGSELGYCLNQAGHQVIGLKRHPNNQHPLPFEVIRADITIASDLKVLDQDIDVLFFIVSGGSRDPANYRAIYEMGVNNILAWQQQMDNKAPWFFVSSTSVYHQTAGEWVDETSNTYPQALTSQYILAAERQVTSYNPENVIVRFSGIYGPGREYLLRMAKQVPTIQQHPPYYTNRIHQRDCVGVLTFLLTQRLAGINLRQCYLASDDTPAPLWEVMSWLAAQSGYAPPIAKSAELGSDMNKRCNNHLLKALGYPFLYPCYQNGYSELITASALEGRL